MRCFMVLLQSYLCVFKDAFWHSVFVRESRLNRNPSANWSANWPQFKGFFLSYYLLPLCLFGLIMKMQQMFLSPGICRALQGAERTDEIDEGILVQKAIRRRHVRPGKDG